MTDLLYTDVEESLRSSVRSTLQRDLDDGLPARLADEPDTDVSGLWRSLAEQLVSQMLNLRLRDIARRPNAPFLGASAGTSSIGRTLELFEIEAAVPEGQITEGLGAIVQEAKRMQLHGFSNDPQS